MNDSSHSTVAKPNRKQLFVVLSLFVAPLLLAFAVYYGSSWRPTSTTNKGDLIAPAIPLPVTTLIKADGTATDAKFLRDNWTLVYVGAGACDAICRKALADTRDARLLLGKDIVRVDRAFLYTGACCDSAYFAAQQQGLILASVDSEAGQALLKLFPHGGGAVIGSHRTYIVDPLGNLMMSYEPGTDPRSIYQDLKKLLTLSHIG
jgi:cytochrome oxidase Cu insertion factor (SCO1/SenC/PrrC family)